MFCVKRSSFILTLLVAAVFAGSVASAQSVTPIPVTVCFPIGGSVYQVMYLPQYYTYKYIQPKVKIVGFVESPATTPRGVTLSLAQNGTDCYAYFGPGNSGIATAVNAVMNSLWVAASVTATEFSDRINYPLFNRVIPRVDVNQRAITLLMKQFQWTTINILCTDNTYGQAVTAAIGKILGDVGGQATPSCISQYGTYADAANVVQAALNSPTRVLFISAVTGEAAYVQGIQAINNLDVNRQLIVLFAEPACTGNDPLWKTVPSSFCATFTTTATYDPFWAAFLTRDTKAEAAVVNAIAGSKYSATTANTFSGYSALAADGARLTFQALDTYVGLYGALPPSPAAAVAWLRNQTLLDGFLGPIQIPNGDRLQPTFMRIYNAGLNNVTSIVGNVTSDGNLTLASSLFVLGQQRALANIPPAIDPATSSTSQTSAWIALAVVLAMLLLIFGAAAYMIRQRQLLAVRPMDPAAPFAVMFVGVKNVDEVRDAGDANSAAAFAQVANDLRAAVRASGCYEARRVDESTVMVVAKKVDNVLQCASQLMTSMDRVDWRAVMCHANEMAVLAQVRRERTGTDTQSRRSRQSHTQSAAQRQNSFLERSRDSDNRSAARTHRSRATSHNIAGGAFPVLHVGIHYGFGMIDHDDSLNTVSYVGKVVTHAAEVADVAVAGQILVSRETHEAFESASSSSLGAFERINAWETVAPDTTMFIPATQAAEAVAAMQAAVKRAIDGIHKAGRATTGAGSIAAALQRADAGLSQRRIGALSLHIPALRELSNDVTKIETVADLIAEVTDTATVHRGEIHSMSNGTILITVNAGAPAAQPVARAALIAMEVLEYLDSQQLSGSAGVAGGLALVGRPTQGAAFATFGTAVELAEVAQRMAAKHRLKVCAVDTNSYDDLAARLHVATIDIVPNAGSRDGMSRLLAIVGERDATAGEWLYSVGSATAGIASNEQAWEQVTQLECPSDAAVDTLDQELVNCTSVLWSQLYTTSLRNLRAYMPLLQATAGDGALDRTTFVASLAKSSQ